MCLEADGDAQGAEDRRRMKRGYVALRSERGVAGAPVDARRAHQPSSRPSATVPGMIVQCSRYSAPGGRSVSTEMFRHGDRSGISDCGTMRFSRHTKKSREPVALSIFNLPSPFAAPI